MPWLFTFLHLVFVGAVALFPPINPIGTALIIDPFFRGTRLEDRKLYSRKIASYCLILCTVAMVAGSWIFKLFGISLPVVQLAGGILSSPGTVLLTTGLPTSTRGRSRRRRSAPKTRTCGAVRTLRTESQTRGAFRYRAVFGNAQN